MSVKKALAIFLFIIVFCTPLILARPAKVIDKPKYRIDITDNAGQIKIDYNEFYFIHSIIIDIFVKFNIDFLTTAEKIDIIVTLNTYIKDNWKVDLTIKKYSGNKDLFVSLIECNDENNDKISNILLVTNHIKTQDEQADKIENSSDLYTKMYQITNGLMVEYNNIYIKKTESDLITSGNMNLLADYYLYDDNLENNSKIENLLIDIIKKTDYNSKSGSNLVENINKRNKIYFCFLTLAEFYMSAGDYDRSENILDKARDVVTVKYEKHLNTVREELEITKEMFRLKNINK